MSGDHPDSASPFTMPKPDAPATDPARPGDEAPPGTPGTGETLCKRCGGVGRLEGAAMCPDCDGTGIVMGVVGGA